MIVIWYKIHQCMDLFISKGYLIIIVTRVKNIEVNTQCVIRLTKIINLIYHFICSLIIFHKILKLF